VDLLAFFFLAGREDGESMALGDKTDSRFLFPVLFNSAKMIA
jgi:hypothetical protein